MRSTFVLNLGLLLAGAINASAAMQVVSLHPFVSDLAREVGGDRVVVHDLMPIGGNPHSYEPSPGDLQKVAEADLVLASGKKLELYLNKIRDNMNSGATLFEVGRKVPSCLIEADNEVFVCCPAHSAGSIDPHWWHSLKSMQRAAKLLGQEFERLDPGHKADYAKRAKSYDRELEELYKSARKAFAKIPRKERYLTTAHASFGYFCRDFGFKAVPIQGLTKERNPSPQYLAETIRVLQKNKIKVVFPESVANPKVLAALVKETGVKLGGRLLADGPSEKHPTYLEAYRHNLKTILEGFQS